MRKTALTRKLTKGSGKKSHKQCFTATHHSIIMSQNSGSKNPRKGLNFDSLFWPVSEVKTSIGLLYLYRLSTTDLDFIKNQFVNDSQSDLRAFIPQVASLVKQQSHKDERIPLPTEAVAQLSNADLELFIEQYTTIVQSGSLITGSSSALERKPEESAVAFLMRLLKHESSEAEAASNKLREQFFTPNASGLFDKVRKSSLTLGSTLSEFERINSNTASVVLREPIHAGLQHTMKETARHARERDEELEMVRLTGKMTAESAQTLKDLAEAATVLLEKLDERDQKADRVMRRQINIAVVSVVVSAALALLALFVAAFSYFQDRANIEAGDVWQRQLLDAVTESNRKSTASEQATTRLQSRVVELETLLIKTESSRSSTNTANTKSKSER